MRQLEVPYVLQLLVGMQIDALWLVQICQSICVYGFDGCAEAYNANCIKFARFGCRWISTQPVLKLTPAS